MSELQTIPIEIIKLVRNGLQSPLKSIDVLENILGIGAISTLFSPLANSNHKILIFDDVHKASPLIARYILKIASTISNHQINTSVIFAFRPGKLKASYYLSELKVVSSINAKLNSPTIDDVIESFKINKFSINEHIVKSYLSEKPITTLAVCNILDEINRRIDKEDRCDAFSKCHISIMREVFNGRDKIVQEKFIRIKKYLALLDIIYAYGTGISIQHILAGNIDVSTDIINLLEDLRLVRVVDDKAYPYHDTYVKKYKQFRKNINKSHVGDFVARFKDDNTYPLTDSLALIIRCGKKFANKYLKRAIHERDRLRGKAVYGPILKLSEAICETIVGINIELSVYDRLKSYFVYAECLNHCGETEKARNNFEIVKKISTQSGGLDVHVDGLRYDAEAEIFNLDYWALKSSSAHLQRMTRFADKMKKIIALTEYSSRHIQAYLTILNRIMVSYLLNDEYELAAKAFTTCINEARRFEKENYCAYAYSDYGKGLYYHDPSRAKHLLNKARVKYIKVGNQSRRLAVNNVEISFINILLGEGSIDILYANSNALLDNGLFSEYKNAMLKIVGILLSIGATEEAMERLSGLIAFVESGFGPRSKMLIANLMTVYYFLTNKEEDARNWAKSHYNIAKSIGQSYFSLAEHNYTSSGDSKVVFAFENLDKRKTICIDPRMW